MWTEKKRYLIVFIFQALVEDQLIQEVELLRLRRVRYIPDIPDTLYMVQEKPRTLGLDVLAASIPGKYTLVF